MKRAEEEFSGSGLKVIWMGFQDREDKIRDFMIRHDIRSSVGYDTRNVIAGRYGISYGAGVIMIDGEGVVKKRIPKGFSEKNLNEALRHALPPTRTSPLPAGQAGSGGGSG